MTGPVAPPSGPGPAPSPDPVTARAAATIRAKFSDAVVEESTAGRHPFLRIDAKRLLEVAKLLRDEANFDCCHLVSYSKKPDPAYRRNATKNDAWLCLKVRVPRNAPDVPSVMSVWPGADWHERETWDLMGIRFTGRGAVRRILLPEDWPGHPLRKDWEYPADYHGVPIIPPEGL